MVDPAIMPHLERICPLLKILRVSFFFLLISNETGLPYFCTALTAFHCTCAMF